MRNQASKVYETLAARVNKGREFCWGRVALRLKPRAPFAKSPFGDWPRSTCLSGFGRRSARLLASARLTDVALRPLRVPPRGGRPEAEASGSVCEVPLRGLASVNLLEQVWQAKREAFSLRASHGRRPGGGLRASHGRRPEVSVRPCLMRTDLRTPRSRYSSGPSSSEW